MTDPQNRTTSYTYDKLNRRTKEIFNDNSFVQYTYDPNGNFLTMTDALGTTRYVYDEINRLKSSTDCFGKTVSYSFDEDSNITDISYPGNKTVQYAFDDAGRMTSVTDWLNRSTTYGYNALGRIVSTLYENGSKTDIGYDSAGRLTSYTDKKSDGSVIASYAYTLDPNGNRLSATVTEPMAPKFSSSEYNFQYNTLNQLTSGPNSGFTFDANGNLIQEVAVGKTITYGYDDNDRLVSWSDGAESYQYTYSGTKDLMEVEKGGEKTRYVLDVNQNLPAVVARTDGSGEILDYFVYGAAGLVSKITPAGQAFTYHFDPTGSTVAMSDSSENLVNTYAYTPYGKTTRQESIDNPFEYVGRFGVMAEDNGLNYMRARFYHPGIRRFISRDTVWGEVSSPQSLNLYAYVEGNPVMLVDPSGNISQTVERCKAIQNLIEDIDKYIITPQKNLIDRDKRHASLNKQLKRVVLGMSTIFLKRMAEKTTGPFSGLIIEHMIEPMNNAYEASEVRFVNGEVYDVYGQFITYTADASPIDPKSCENDFDPSACEKERKRERELDLKIWVGQQRMYSGSKEQQNQMWKAGMEIMSYP